MGKNRHRWHAATEDTIAQALPDCAGTRFLHPEITDDKKKTAMCIQWLDSLQKTDRTPVNVCA